MKSLFLFLTIVSIQSVSFANEILIYKDAGAQDRLIEDRAGKWIVVNYWATWCPPCLREIPELNIFYKNNLKKNITVLGVNIKEGTNYSIEDRINKLGIIYPVIINKKNNPKDSLVEVKSLPTTVIITPNGKVVHIIRNSINNIYLEAVIDRLKMHFEKAL